MMIRKTRKNRFSLAQTKDSFSLAKMKCLLSFHWTFTRYFWVVYMYVKERFQMFIMTDLSNRDDISFAEISQLRLCLSLSSSNWVRVRLVAFDLYIFASGRCLPLPYPCHYSVENPRSSKPDHILGHSTLSPSIWTSVDLFPMGNAIL